MVPSLLTLASLVAGLAALTRVIEGDLVFAGWLIVTAGALDLLDGGVARFTKTGSPFGAQLDSHVDAISFGVAPAFLVQRSFMNETPWGWVLCFCYVIAAVLRLARFNVEQAGRREQSICGLAAPLAGVTVAAGVLVSETDAFSLYVSAPIAPIATAGMLILSVLMLSRVRYGRIVRVPRLSDWRAFHVSVAMGFVASLWILPHSLFLFLVGYICWGLIRAAIPGEQPASAVDRPDNVELARPDLEAEPPLFRAGLR